MSSKFLDSLDPVPRTTLSEQVAKCLAARITGGDWQPGEKLPSEAELCKAFNVGRSTLREALTSLAFIGLIRMRAGGGSYVGDKPSAYFTSSWLNGGLLTSEKALGEFVEVRLALGSEVASLCAERITSEELDEIELLVEKMRISIHDSEEFAKLDVAFHLAMAISSKNEALNRILSGVREQTMELITKSVLLEEGRENALHGHIKILEAVRQHNPAKAREALRDHLKSCERGYKVVFEQHRLNQPA